MEPLTVSPRSASPRSTSPRSASPNAKKSPVFSNEFFVTDMKPTKANLEEELKRKLDKKNPEDKRLIEEQKLEFLRKFLIAKKTDFKSVLKFALKFEEAIRNMAVLFAANPSANSVRIYYQATENSDVQYKEYTKKDLTAMKEMFERGVNNIYYHYLVKGKKQLVISEVTPEKRNGPPVYIPRTSPFLQWINSENFTPPAGFTGKPLWERLGKNSLLSQGIAHMLTPDLLMYISIRVNNLRHPVNKFKLSDAMARFWNSDASPKADFDFKTGTDEKGKPTVVPVVNSNENLKFLDAVQNKINAKFENEGKPLVTLDPNDLSSYVKRFSAAAYMSLKNPNVPQSIRDVITQNPQILIKEAESVHEYNKEVTEFYEEKKKQELLQQEFQQ